MLGFTDHKLQLGVLVLGGLTAFIYIEVERDVWRHTDGCRPATSTTLSDYISRSGMVTYYSPLIPPSVRYTFFVMPIIPSLASSSENWLRPP
jgi:hypothetical protein